MHATAGSASADAASRVRTWFPERLPTFTRSYGRSDSMAARGKFSTAGFGRWCVAVGLGCGWFGGCAGNGQQATSLAELRGGTEIGLRRGAVWNTVTVKRPHIIGPRVNLKLEGSELRGQLDGRGVHVTIGKDGAEGSAPFGTVALDISDGPTELRVSGSWNGSRADVKVTAESLRATVAVWNGRTLASVQSCQYVLNRLERDGARTGSSTCSGMPEATVLEVPAAIANELSRQELLVVLLALLSVPPMTHHDVPLGI